MGVGISEGEIESLARFCGVFVSRNDSLYSSQIGCEDVKKRFVKEGGGISTFSTMRLPTGSTSYNSPAPSKSTREMVSSSRLKKIGPPLLSSLSNSGPLPCVLDFR